jgi:uncharacterized protein YkwD
LPELILSALIEFHMSGKSAIRRSSQKLHKGPAKVIRMPTPTVVRRRRAIKAGMGLLAVSLIGAVVARLYLMQSVPPAAESVAGLNDQESEILKLVNDERKRSGLKPLVVSPALTAVARAHSDDMALHHYTGHRDYDGGEPEDRVSGAGIPYEALGENIYVDDYRDVSGLAKRALAAWLKSPAHRATLLSNRYSATGVGAARSGDGKTCVTQDFVR